MATVMITLFFTILIGSGQTNALTNQDQVTCEVVANNFGIQAGDYPAYPTDVCFRSLIGYQKFSCVLNSSYTTYTTYTNSNCTVNSSDPVRARSSKCITVETCDYALIRKYENYNCTDGGTKTNHDFVEKFQFLGCFPHTIFENIHYGSLEIVCNEDNSTVMGKSFFSNENCTGEADYSEVLYVKQCDNEIECPNNIIDTTSEPSCAKVVDVLHSPGIMQLQYPIGICFDGNLLETLPGWYERTECIGGTEQIATYADFGAPCTPGSFVSSSNDEYSSGPTGNKCSKQDHEPLSDCVYFQPAVLASLEYTYSCKNDKSKRKVCDKKGANPERFESNKCNSDEIRPCEYATIDIYNNIGNNLCDDNYNIQEVLSVIRKNLVINDCSRISGNLSGQFVCSSPHSVSELTYESTNCSGAILSRNEIWYQKECGDLSRIRNVDGYNVECSRAFCGAVLVNHEISDNIAGITYPLNLCLKWNVNWFYPYVYSSYEYSCIDDVPYLNMFHDENCTSLGLTKTLNWLDDNNYTCRDGPKCNYYALIKESSCGAPDVVVKEVAIVTGECFIDYEGNKVDHGAEKIDCIYDWVSGETKPTFIQRFYYWGSICYGPKRKDRIPNWLIRVDGCDENTGDYSKIMCSTFHTDHASDSNSNPNLSDATSKCYGSIVMHLYAMMILFFVCE